MRRRAKGCVPLRVSRTGGVLDPKGPYDGVPCLDVLPFAMDKPDGRRKAKPEDEQRVARGLECIEFMWSRRIVRGRSPWRT